VNPIEKSIIPAITSRTKTAMLCLSSALNAFLSKTAELMPSIDSTHGSENAINAPQNRTPPTIRIATITAKKNNFYIIQHSSDIEKTQ